MAAIDCRTRVRSVIVDTDPGFPVELRLLTPDPNSQWAGWSCAITGTLRLRAQCQHIESVRVCFVSTILDEIAVEYSSGDDLYRFGGLISTVCLSRHSDIVLNVLMRGGGDFNVCRIEVECDIPELHQSVYSPILINALPRSGTTWLAALLSEHPQVVTYPAYPHEVRQCVYWMSLLRILTNPYNNFRERREMRFAADRYLVGGSPYYTSFLEDLVPWYATAYSEELLEFMQRLVDKYYRNIEAIHGRRKSGPRHFVEKFPGRLQALAMRWIFRNVREIYLVRNPFDVLRSVLRFNQMRGYPDFGEETLGRSEALVRMLALQSHENLTFFEQRCHSGSGVIIKYEDLVAYPLETLRELLKSFGLCYSTRVIQSMIDGAGNKQLPNHVTSGFAPTERESALAPEEEMWISKYFAELLKRFYSLNGRSSDRRPS